MKFILVLFSIGVASAQAQWSVGAAKVKITPSEPIWLSGYASRTRPSEGVLQDIYVKAAAFQENGQTSVLLTSDLQGLDVAMIDDVAARAHKQFGVPRERLVLNYSHNHSAPVTGQVLHLYYDLAPDQKAIVDRYTRWLQDRMVQAIGDAIANLAPAELSFEQGLAGLAVNRRRSRPGGRSLFGPVDPDVPVLAVRAPGGKLSAILFGYSCYTTALSGYQINGDYAGYAQHILEAKYPGATALFVQGCGGDANPLPRIMNSDWAEAIELATMYGTILSRAVEAVLRAPMQSVVGPLRTAYAVVEVPVRKPPTREALEARLRQATGGKKRQVQYLLQKLIREGRLPESHPNPIQVWRFGTSLSFIALTGESVVDYCLRFKKQYGNDNTWVAGYNNELLSYVPSLRVLREGGYEGVDDMDEYGLPSPYAEELEETIARKVDELMAATKSRWERIRGLTI
jgi:neutral ceramidase